MQTTNYEKRAVEAGSSGGGAHRPGTGSSVGFEEPDPTPTFQPSDGDPAYGTRVLVPTGQAR